MDFGYNPELYLSYITVDFIYSRHLPSMQTNIQFQNEHMPKSLNTTEFAQKNFREWATYLFLPFIIASQIVSIIKVRAMVEIVLFLALSN